VALIKLLLKCAPLNSLQLKLALKLTARVNVDAPLYLAVRMVFFFTLAENLPVKWFSVSYILCFRNYTKHAVHCVMLNYNQTALNYCLSLHLSFFRYRFA
jgi:hypothetical protein